MTFMFGYLCGAASMLLLVVLYAALRVGGDYDAHMLAVNSDDDDDGDDDDWDCDPIDPDAEYILADYLTKVGQ